MSKATKKVGNSSAILLLTLIVGTIVGYFIMVRQPWWLDFISFVQQYLYLYVAVLVLIKFIGIIWPPLPGGVFIIASIPVIGWKWAFLAHFMGSLFSALLSYYLGRRYGARVISRVIGEESLELINGFKINPGRHSEFVFMALLMFGGVAELIYYGSGVLKFPFKSYFIGIFLALLASAAVFPLYGNIFSGDNRWVSLGSLFAISLVIVLFRKKFEKRYFSEPLITRALGLESMQ